MICANIVVVGLYRCCHDRNQTWRHQSRRRRRRRKNGSVRCGDVTEAQGAFGRTSISCTGKNFIKLFLRPTASWARLETPAFSHLITKVKQHEHG